MCAKCGAKMRIMAIIKQKEVIQKILTHLNRWDPRPPSQAPPEDEKQIIGPVRQFL